MIENIMVYAIEAICLGIFMVAATLATIKAIDGDCMMAEGFCDYNQGYAIDARYITRVNALKLSIIKNT